MFDIWARLMLVLLSLLALYVSGFTLYLAWRWFE